MWLLGLFHILVKSKKYMPEVSMDLTNQLVEHEEYKRLVGTLEAEEADRKFCKHDFAHFLNVARIAYIENLERGLGISKDLIYTAALLHDIGRCSEFEEFTNHDEAGAYVARKILGDLQVDDDIINYVADAIFNHGNKYIADYDDISGLMYRADKKSRLCEMCDAYDECNWPEDRKNRRIMS
ncbi:MAG TPA: hypothetical protein DEO82_07675 [Eubacterium sp.]|nr:hypothetical protein [Eubacterium sp.]